MTTLEDMASFSIKELKLNKAEPKTETEWSIIKSYLLSKCLAKA